MNWMCEWFARGQERGARVLVVTALLLALFGASCGGDADTKAVERVGTSSEAIFVVPPVPVIKTEHPRLWVSAADLPTLRSWAVPSNPAWVALKGKAQSMLDDYNKLFLTGNWPDIGQGPYYTEQWASTLAFAAMVDPNGPEPWATAAKALLMYVMNHAPTSAAEEVTTAPVRSDESTWFKSVYFSVGDRVRDNGRLFFLAFDWLMANPTPMFTANEITRIQQVALRWAYANTYRPGGADVPLPYGVMNDPILVSDKTKLRFSDDNYRNGHYAMVTHVALAFDPPYYRVDPAQPDEALGNTVASYRNHVAYAWDYQNATFFDTDGYGGAPLEGWEYGNVSMALLASTALSQHTSGMEDLDPALYPQHIHFLQHRYWDDFLDWMRHSLSPTRQKVGNVNLLMFMATNYGQAQRLYPYSQLTNTLGALAVRARLEAAAGDAAAAARLAKLKWLIRDALEGGSADFPRRLKDVPVLTFMVFQPSDFASTSPWPDPWATAPTVFTATSANQGFARVLARTGWDSNASWFTFYGSYMSIFHQMPYNGTFDLFRKGQWMTKQRAGYFQRYGDAPEYQNILAVQNSPSKYMVAPDTVANERGGQYFGNTGDPKIVVSTAAGAYIGVDADLTGLYNSKSLGTPVKDVTHVSRTLLWLKPDAVVVYDRAQTITSGRFKRFHLSVTAAPTIAGNTFTVPVSAAQQLSVRSILPDGAALSSFPKECDIPTDPASICNRFEAGGEPTAYALRIEAPGGPTAARFLTVLQATDAGVAPAPASRIGSTAGIAYDGVVAGAWAALFKHDFAAVVDQVSFVVPSAVTSCFVTGLQPGGGYQVTVTPTPDGNKLVTVSKGGGPTADAAGVLATSI